MSKLSKQRLKQKLESEQRIADSIKETRDKYKNDFSNENIAITIQNLARTWTDEEDPSYAIIDIICDCCEIGNLQELFTDDEINNINEYKQALEFIENRRQQDEY